LSIGWRCSAFTLDCRDVRDQFREAGWTADVIDGTMDDASRQTLVKRLANGSLNVLVSCNVVNEGFDVPKVAGAILLRPTKSLAMNLQTVGRALRMKSDGSKAIILDHAGNVHRFGPPDVEREWSLEGKMKVEAKSHHCMRCEKVFKAGTKRSEVTEQCSDYETCPLLRVKETPAEGKAPDVVEGELAVYKPPEWTDGTPLQADVAGANYVKLMELSQGRRDRLEQIRKARGYKAGWTHFKMNEFDENGKWIPNSQ
jgi:superfamily II DNA or RNA helicase